MRSKPDCACNKQKYRDSKHGDSLGVAAKSGQNSVLERLEHSNRVKAQKIVQKLTCVTHSFALYLPTLRETGNCPSPRSMEEWVGSSMVEQRPFKALVAGSSPAPPTTLITLET